MEFSADTLRLNLIDLARTGSKLIAVTGRLEYACMAVDTGDPVTFSTRDAHLVSHLALFFGYQSAILAFICSTYDSITTCLNFVSYSYQFRSI